MLAFLLVILPVLFALVLLFFNNKTAKYIALFGTVTNFILTVYTYTIFQQNFQAELLVFAYKWIPLLNANFIITIDGFSMLMVFLTNLVMPLIIATTFNRNIKNEKAYFSLILLMQAALIGVFEAKDAMCFYLFWELALLPIYFICLIWGGENRKKITFKFFIYTLLGSLFMLLGILFLYFKSVDYNFVYSSLYVTAKGLPLNQQLLVFALFFIAFAIKIPIFPFHTWQADTYTNAPTQGTMLLSGIMLKMGLFGIVRWLIPLAPKAWIFLSKYVIILCVISVIYASLMAIAQSNFKRMLAYSSMAHVGLIAAGIFTFNMQGLQGAMIQMVSHAILVVGMFYCNDIITNKLGIHNMKEMGGIRNISPLFAVLFMVIMLGSIALPLTNGFVGEFLLFHGLFQFNYVLAGIAGLSIILGATYTLRAYQNVMHGETNEITTNFGKLYTSEILVLSFIVILVIVFGIYPKPLLDITELASKGLIDYVLNMAK